MCSNDKCKHSRTWRNQGFCRDLPIINLLMSAAVYVSGTACSKALRLFSFMKVCFTNGIILLTAVFITLNITINTKQKSLPLFGYLAKKFRSWNRPGNISQGNAVQQKQALFIYYYASASSTFIDPMKLTKASLKLLSLLITDTAYMFFNIVLTCKAI